MKISKKRLAASVFFAAVALAVAVMIFAFSAQQSDASTNFSSSITAISQSSINTVAMLVIMPLPPLFCAE